MDDVRFEDTLRAALRGEVDTLPLRITPGELERHATVRRRALRARRMVVAAALAAIAIGTGVAIGTGWLRLPAVGDDHPVITVTHEPTPGRPLGGASDAIIVRILDDPASAVRRIEVQRWPSAGDMSVIATFSGILGADPSPLGAPQVSVDGLLAVPLVGSARNEPGEAAGLAIYDLHDVARDPRLIPEVPDEGIAWGPDGRLAILDGSDVAILDVDEGWSRRAHVAIPRDVRLRSPDGRGPIWTAAGDGLLGLRWDGTAFVPGMLGLDGAWRRTEAPVVFAPTGRERIMDTRGWVLSDGCAATAEPPRSGDGCGLDAVLPGTFELEVWHPGETLSAVWAANGAEAWVLVDASGDSGLLTTEIRKGPALDVSIVQVIGDVEGRWEQPTIDGLTRDDERMVLSYGSRDAPRHMTVLVDTVTGDWLAADGTFAGWADQRGTRFPLVP